MTDRIRELAQQAGVKFTNYGSGDFIDDGDCDTYHLQKFAELIVQECTDSCRKLWYEENNRKDISDHEDPRSVGFRSGMKAGITKCINEIVKLSKP